MRAAASPSTPTVPSQSPTSSCATQPSRGRAAAGSWRAARSSTSSHGCSSTATSQSRHGGGIDNQGSGEFVDRRHERVRQRRGGRRRVRQPGRQHTAGLRFDVLRQPRHRRRRRIPARAATRRPRSRTRRCRATSPGSTAAASTSTPTPDCTSSTPPSPATRHPTAAGSAPPTPIDNFPVASHPLLRVPQHDRRRQRRRSGLPRRVRLGGRQPRRRDAVQLRRTTRSHERRPAASIRSPTTVDRHRPMRSPTFSPAVGGGVEPCPATDQRGVTREADRPATRRLRVRGHARRAPPPDGPHPETTRSTRGRPTRPPTPTPRSRSRPHVRSGDRSSARSTTPAFAACTSPARVLRAGDRLAHASRCGPSMLAGIVDPTPASYTWTIESPPDSTPPETSIDSTPPASTDSRDAMFDVLDRRSRRDVRVLARRRRLRRLHLADCRTPACATAPTRSPCAPTTPPATRIPTPATLHLDGRRHRRTRRHRRRRSSRRRQGRPRPSMATFVFSADEAGIDVRVRRRRRRRSTRAPHRCELARPQRRSAHVRRRRDRSGRQRRSVGPGEPHVDDRAAGDTTPPETAAGVGAGQPDREPDRGLHVLLQRVQLDVRVRTRRCPVRRDARRPPSYSGLVRRRPHVRGARDRPGRQRRPDAGELHVDDRRTTASSACGRDQPRLRSGQPDDQSTTARFTFSASRARRPVRLLARRRALCRLHVTGRRITGLLPATTRSTCGRPISAGNTDSRACTLDDRGAAAVRRTGDARRPSPTRGSTRTARPPTRATTPSSRSSRRPHATTSAPLLQFPIPSLPSGCVVESATLSVYAASASPDRMLEVRRLAAGLDGERRHVEPTSRQTVGAAVTAELGHRVPRLGRHLPGRRMATPAAPTTASSSATRKAARASSSSSTAGRRERRHRSS